MDKLSVIRKAEKQGGESRRSALEHLMVTARDLGCDLDVGGGMAGGMNIRYGSIRYAVIDVNTKGLVKLYVQPHPNKDAPEKVVDTLNGFIDDTDDLEPKSFPINSYSHLEAKIEDIPEVVIEDYMEMVVELIRETYYRKHFLD